jgi:hypothetical protein
MNSLKIKITPLFFRAAHHIEHPLINNNFSPSVVSDALSLCACPNQHQLGAV